MESAEMKLIRTCQAIGAVAGWNSVSTYRFASLVGDRLLSMTVGELLAAAEEYTVSRERIYRNLEY